MYSILSIIAFKVNPLVSVHLFNMSNMVFQVWLTNHAFSTLVRDLIQLSVLLNLSTFILNLYLHIVACHELHCLLQLTLRMS